MTPELKTTQEVLKYYDEKLVAACKEALATTDLSGFGPSIATGNLYNSIHGIVEGNSVTILGLFYKYWLDHGRKPGTAPPLSAILAWIEAKGIVPNDPNTTVEQLAFLFQRAIKLRGTTIFRRNEGNGGPFASVITPDLIKEIQDALVFSYVTTVKSAFLNGVPARMRK